MLRNFLKKILADSAKNVGIGVVITLVMALATTAIMFGCLALGWCFQWVPWVQFLFKEGQSRLPGYMGLGIFLVYFGWMLYLVGEYLIKTWKGMKVK